MTLEYIQNQQEILEEIRSGINALIHNTLQTRARDDQDRYGKMRQNREKQHKGKPAISSLQDKTDPEK